MNNKDTADICKNIFMPVTIGALIALIIIYAIPPHKCKNLFPWIWFGTCLTAWIVAYIKSKKNS